MALNTYGCKKYSSFHGINMILQFHFTIFPDLGQHSSVKHLWWSTPDGSVLPGLDAVRG